MSTEKVKLILKNVLLALQFFLGVWQFMKLTPVGAWIHGVVGWLLRPLGLSPTYYPLRHCPGRVFKRANCFTLQTDIPSERRGTERDEVDTIKLDYLGSNLLLEKKGMNGNMLFVNKKMCYYITRTIWEELRTLEDVLSYGLAGPPIVSAEIVRARAEHHAATAAEATRDYAAAQTKSAACAAALHAAFDKIFTSDNATFVAPSRPPMRLLNAIGAAVNAPTEVAAYAPSETAAANAPNEVAAYAPSETVAAYAPSETAAAYVYPGSYESAAAAAAAAASKVRADLARRNSAAADADAARAANRASHTLFVKGNKLFWKDIITGGVMTVEEVLDAIILYNQHVSVRLNNDWLLPINLLVSEERVLKILNLIALFLLTKKVKVHWFLPICLSFISALLEFNIRIRILLYTKINILFCYIVHFICDPLPYSWRQQIYSLGKWVENLTPCNDIQLKVVRGKISAIISQGAKVDQEGAILVSWLSVPDEEEGTLNFGFIEKKFPCNPTHITCTYLIRKQVCEISAPTISEFYVKCKNDDDFRHIITFVSCIAENRCGSLISYGPNKKVRVRGFEESVTSYVDNGLPSVYKLELANVVVA